MSHDDVCNEDMDAMAPWSEDDLEATESYDHEDVEEDQDYEIVEKNQDFSARRQPKPNQPKPLSRWSMPPPISSKVSAGDGGSKIVKELPMKETVNETTKLTMKDFLTEFAQEVTRLVTIKSEHDQATKKLNELKSTTLAYKSPELLRNISAHIADLAKEFDAKRDKITKLAPRIMSNKISTWKDICAVARLDTVFARLYPSGPNVASMLSQLSNS